MSNKVLYNSEEVKFQIREVFKAPRGRRIAIVAFVGKGADKYLPSPKGLLLICWPKGGGTNPDVLRYLEREKGVRVRFAKNLHMKIYWAENRGAVISSANLSNNALGSGHLKECGIRIDSEQMGINDIKRIIKYIKPWKPDEDDYAQLDRDHRKYYGLNPDPKQRGKVTPFIEWYRDPKRALWKMGWWEERGDISKTAKEKSRREFNTEPYSALATKRNTYKPYEWILQYKIRGKSISNVGWMYVNFKTKVTPEDFKDEDDYDVKYPYEAVQVDPMHEMSFGPPFPAGKRFTRAFIKALRQYKNIKKTRPSRMFIDLIKKYY
jgi:hypothetical protein